MNCLEHFICISLGFFCCASVYFSILFLFFFSMRETISLCRKKPPKMHCSGLSLAATIKTATQFKIHHNSRNSKTDKAFKLCEHTFKRISVSKLRQRIHNLTVEGEFEFQWSVSIFGKCQKKVCCVLKSHQYLYKQGMR